MKVSVLLPSLNPDLAARAIASLRDHGGAPGLLEIVVCSPFKIEGEGVVWVEDADPSGNNPAIRKAFAAATGGIIVPFTDDAVALPGWLAKALGQFVPAERKHRLGKTPYIMGLQYAVAGTCFGRYYANFPMASRRTVETLFDDYYSFSAHWGDVSFSMAAHEKGGTVEICKEGAQLEFVADRLGAPTSPHKASSFMKDTAAFLKRYRDTDLAKGWPVENFRDYNIDVPTAAVMNREGRLCVPDRAQFLKEVTGEVSPLQGQIDGGLWVLPTHKRPDRCQRTLDAIIATGSVSRGVVVVNGGEQPEQYEHLRLPTGWTVARYPHDVPVCDIYRWFPVAYPDLKWYGIIPDDVVPETAGWDVELIKSSGTHRMASANDGWQAPKRIHGATVIGGAIVKALGHFCPPGIQHNYHDDFLEALGNDLKLWTVRMDVMTRHEHPGVGGGKMDASYEANFARMSTDKPHFDAWHANRLDDYNKIVNVFPHIKRLSADLRGKKVFIVTPTGSGRPTYQYVHSLISTVRAFNANGIGFKLLLIPGESLIMRARNAALRSFIESDCDLLLFIDDDMGWSADNVLRLLMYQKDFVGAAGPRKAEPMTFCCNFHGPEVQQQDGLIDAKEVGAAFLLLSRSCIERMTRAYGHDLQYTDTASGLKYVALFDTRLVDGHMWSEDYTFCQRWKAIGGNVWIDPHIELTHVGQKEFTGALMDMLRQCDSNDMIAGAAE